MPTAKLTSKPTVTTKSEPTATHPVYKEYPQTISLQSVVNENAKSLSAQSTDENNDFSQEELDSAWMGFAKAESARRPRLSSLLASQIPQKPIEGSVLRFMVDSQTVKEYLYKNLHKTLEEYLRENLHNSSISLRFEMAGDAEADAREKGLPYTSKEKYMFLLDKNPELKLLRDAFDLETD